MDYRKSWLEELNITNNFWEGKKVLITGHSGFKGGWLSLWLQKLKADVIGYSLSIPTTPSFFEITKADDNMISIFGDMRDFNTLQNVISKYKPEIIFHLAAQSLVLSSYESPLDTYSTNVMGTLNLFESIKKNSSVKVIVNVTSDKCYENKDLNIPFKETDPMGGNDLYSSSKACSEILTNSYRNSFFNPKEYEKHNVSIATARSGNVIGGGDWSDYRIVPDLIKGIQQRKTVFIRNPESRRPWQFVLEPLSGYIVLAEKLWHDGQKYSESWNFGPLKEEEKPVSHLVSKFSEEWNELKIKFKKETRKESKYLRLDCNKSKDQLGWQTSLNLDNTIEWTINWYKDFFEGKNMQIVSFKQIDKFTKLNNLS
jgi:CDP-glucose 4,6-dehydratase